MDSFIYEEPPVSKELNEEKVHTIQELYPDWHKRANCLGQGEEIFFGASEPDIRPPYTLGDIKKAKAMCGGCPVSAYCLRSALKNREEYGVWAGTTRKQRRRMFDAIDQGAVSIDGLVAAYEESRGKRH